jgi:plasmid stabilization system protein ParE
MKPFTLLKPAEQELLESTEYYNRESPGLGDRFLGDFLSLMERLSRYPESGKRTLKRLRVAGLRSFPYSVVYGLAEDHLVVVAVAHQSRRSGYWKDRI